MVVGLAVLASAVVGIVVLSGDSNETSTASESQTSDMSAMPADLQGAIERAIARQSMENVYVLDVRTDAEWNEEHAAGAVHWGLVEHLENGEMPDIPLDAEIYVTCRSGNRAGQAIKIMQDAGFTNLTNIGGLTDWVSAGGATATGVDGSDQ